MRTFILFLLGIAFLFLCGAAPTFAQLVADPNDRLYTDLEIWMDRGLTDNLPPLRPYSVQLVKKTLTQVEARGGEADRKLAAWYLSKMDGGSNFHGVASSLAEADTTNAYLQLGLEGSLQGSIRNSPITYSAKVGALDVGSYPVLPEYQRYLNDWVSDPANGPGPLHLTPRMSLMGGAAIGTDSIYVQSGMFRVSYGPFWGDNTVLSPTAPQAGQFAFVLDQGGMSLTILFMMISPTGNDGSGGTTYGKFLSLGGLEFYPYDWLTLGVFDSVVWGNRFEPLYLLPVVSFYTQGLTGYADNSFIGLSGEIRLPQAMKMDLLLYVDDMGTQWLHGDFNFMLLAALQVGVTWTPNLPFLTRVRLTNLLITPYTYSHKPSDDGSGATNTSLNYLNYTNQGQNMGPSVEPNSDRIEVQALIRPTSWLDLEPFTRFILHGNASTPGWNFVGPDDGSVFHDGHGNSGYTYAPIPPQPGVTYTRFLSQSVLEKVFQAGFDSSAYLSTLVGEVKVTLSYTFQWVIDGSIPGTGPVDGNNSINNYISLGVTFTY